MQSYITAVGVEAGKFKELANVARAHLLGKLAAADLRTAYFAFDYDPALLILATPNGQHVTQLESFIEAVALHLDNAT